MRLLIALLLPWLAFFTIGRPLSGIVCLVLGLRLSQQLANLLLQPSLFRQHAVVAHRQQLAQHLAVGHT